MFKDFAVSLGETIIHPRFEARGRTLCTFHVISPAAENSENSSLGDTAFHLDRVCRTRVI